MAGLQIKLKGGETLGPKLKDRAKRFSEKQTIALQSTANKARELIETEGRANIAEGGNFSSARWQEGFRATLQFVGRNDLVIRVTHAVSYWRVFEFGAKIFGRPMLWIPLSFGNANGRRARDYGKPLFRVNRPGRAPLLLSDDGPQYFGKESVTIPKKWDLRGTVRRVARSLNAIYKEEMRNGK
jgi:hypothetical protein